MKKVILLLLLLVFVTIGAWGQKDFNSIKDMNKYIFQDNDLEKLTKGYFLDYIPSFMPDEKRKLFEQMNNGEMNKELLLSFLQIIETTDITQQFNIDSLLFPVMDEYYANSGSNTMRIPLIIGDIDFSYVNDQVFNDIFIKHVDENPFPKLSKDQINTKNITLVGVFVDTLINSDIQIYWNDNTCFTNTNRKIERIEMIIGENTFEIPKDRDFSLSDFYTETKPLTKIKFTIIYTDDQKKSNEQGTFILKSDEDISRLYTESNSSGFWNEMGGWDGVAGLFQGFPDLFIRVLWGCDNGVNHTILDKPFIIVSGWGPHTDNKTINNAQGWPSTIEQFYWSINENSHFIDSLVGVGYDIVFAKFYPPNASMLSNAGQLETLIKAINKEKFINGSYQENVIIGYSAGAMCVRLTLEAMEHNHMENAANPHHHSKLFISFDGEHGGANVPLGLQHAVNYLKEYHSNPLFALPNYTIYALHYILNAPLSAQLLTYFYTETGSTSNPGQGANFLRTLYLLAYDFFNHSKNTHNPKYPAFTRNISISNGTSQRTASSPITTYYPYSVTDGLEIFKNKRLNNRWKINLLGNISNVVFRFETKPWFAWKVKEEGVVSNPLILDNTPGGTTFLASPEECSDPNIMYQVLNRMEVKTTLLPSGLGHADNIRYDAMYTFTPTFLTHDIKNVNYFQTPGGRRLYYDMKAEGLMYQNIIDISSTDNASPYFGYPHLAHPSNHYTNYTPFDAVFAWDHENTVHIQSGHTEWNNNGDDLPCPAGVMGFLGDEKPKHNRWQQEGNELSNKIRSFILGEADFFNTYIQNRRYGWNANEDDPNYVYKADIVSKHEIFAGDSVTQRTNFKPVEVRRNADVRFIACKSIDLKPGFHAQSGGTFHAKIDQTNCRYCEGFAKAPIYGKSVYMDKVKYLSNLELEEIRADKETDIKLYPNPSTSSVNIEVINDKGSGFYFEVSDINGRIVLSKINTQNIAQFNLQKGFYLVKIKINESWHTRKIIIQ